MGVQRNVSRIIKIWIFGLTSKKVVRSVLIIKKNVHNGKKWGVLRSKGKVGVKSPLNNQPTQSVTEVNEGRTREKIRWLIRETVERMNIHDPGGESWIKE